MNLYTETIEFKLEMEEKALPVAELIQYLQNIQSMIVSINDTLNQKTGQGYDELEVELEACKEGSFRIPTRIRGWLKHPLLVTTYGCFLSPAIGLLFKEDSSSQTMITQEQLLENQTTKDSVASIAQMVVANDRMSSMSLIYRTEAGEEQRLNISKETLKTLSQQEDVAEEALGSEEEYTYREVRLELIGPILEEGSNAWKVRFKGKQLNVAMEDDIFAQRIKAGAVEFKYGDLLIVDLHVQVEQKNVRTQRRYSILQVHSHRHKKLQERQQQHLFDE